MVRRRDVVGYRKAEATNVVVVDDEPNQLPMAVRSIIMDVDTTAVRTIIFWDKCGSKRDHCPFYVTFRKR